MPPAYLTIDDAPSPHLGETIDLLAAANVPALFFCEGRRLAAHPKQARRTVDAGYHLGNHAYSHTHASDLSPTAFRAEVRRTEAEIASIYAQTNRCRPARLFRFPYGDKGGRHRACYQQILTEFGFVPPDRDRFAHDWYRREFGGDRDWAWTVDLNDWTVDTAAGIRQEIDRKRERLRAPGPELILLHDAGNPPDFIATVVRLLVDRGITFRDPMALLDQACHDDRPRCKH